GQGGLRRGRGLQCVRLPAPGVPATPPVDGPPGGFDGARAGSAERAPPTQETTMKRLVMGAVVSATFAALAVPAYAALKQGDAAPDFKAPASLAGKEFQFSLKDALKNAPVLGCVYPS